MVVAFMSGHQVTCEAADLRSTFFTMIFTNLRWVTMYCLNSFMAGWVRISWRFLLSSSCSVRENNFALNWSIGIIFPVPVEVVLAVDVRQFCRVSELYLHCEAHVSSIFWFSFRTHRLSQKILLNLNTMYLLFTVKFIL